MATTKRADGLHRGLCRHCYRSRETCRFVRIRTPGKATQYDAAIKLVCGGCRLKLRGQFCYAIRACRACGCTDSDCRGCVERTGEPCHWVEADLCSACVPAETPNA